MKLQFSAKQFLNCDDNSPLKQSIADTTTTTTTVGQTDGGDVTDDSTPQPTEPPDIQKTEDIEVTPGETPVIPKSSTPPTTPSGEPKSNLIIWVILIVLIVVAIVSTICCLFCCKFSVFNDLGLKLIIFRQEVGYKGWNCHSGHREV